jgi:uncharacterized protein YecT (DUF1311 family)
VRFLILPFAMLALSACHAQSQPNTENMISPAFECGKKPNDVQITNCLEKQVQLSSDRVKAALTRNLKEAATADKDRADFEGPESTFDQNTYVNAVRSSQVAWEKYVEAHCTLESYTALGGTAENHYMLRCLDRLNLQRLKDLRSPFMLESQRLKPVPEE